MNDRSSAQASPIQRSPIVASTQGGPHRDLIKVLERHRGTRYDRPIADHTRESFAWAQSRIELKPRPLVLDAGCGVGEASRELARRFPGHWVVGVDRSAHRLAKGGWSEPGLEQGNIILARAELSDFWRLAHAAGWRLDRHYLLYPNPWPKPGQLMRRWHAHPVFEVVLALGGRLELRTNWRIYAEEFALAVEFLVGSAAAVQYFRPQDSLTPFERKFLASGHQLFRITVDLENFHSHG